MPDLFRYVFPLLFGMIGLWLIMPVSLTYAQSCSGGYVCLFNRYCPCGDPSLCENRVCSWAYAGRQNIGCGPYPDCEVIPDRRGCEAYEGSCSRSGGGGGGGGGGGELECGADGRSNCDTISDNACSAGSCGPCQRRVSYCRSRVSGNNCYDTCVNDNTCPGCCAPSCSPRCGQADGCGGTCSNADAGTPGPITFTSPTSGRADLSDAETVTLGWTAASKADHYTVQIYPQGSGCGQPNTIFCGSQTGRSYTFAPDPTHGNDYLIRVQPVNTTCTSQNGSWQSASFTIFASISGVFYEDAGGDAALSGARCTDPTATATDPGPGATIGAEGEDGSYSQPGIAGQTYRLDVPWWPLAQGGNNLITFTPGTAPNGNQYACTCPGGCRYAGVPAPDSGVNFYLVDINLSHGGWWQVMGGSVYAAQRAGLALQTHIPTDTCQDDPDCEPFMLRRDATGLEQSVGLAVTGGGRLDTTDEPGQQTGYVTDRARQLYATGATLGGVTENYDYFYRRYSMGLAPADDFGASAGDARQPTAPPTNGRAYFRDGDLTVQRPWQVTSDEAFVIFVDGDLHLADPTGVQQLITVEPGGFLAFIVSGDIVIKASVGNDDLDDTTPNIEGVYIANGQIITETAGGGDDRLVGAGTFVGWTSVVLNRDFDDGALRKAENNTRPVELFIYRPDFVLNTPDRMARPHTVWQETN